MKTKVTGYTCWLHKLHGFYKHKIDLIKFRYKSDTRKISKAKEMQLTAGNEVSLRILELNMIINKIMQIFSLIEVRHNERAV